MALIDAWVYIQLLYECVCLAVFQCEPLYGWGFRRGGYRCMCKPGYRYPQYQNGPFMGAEIESATEEEYQNGFDCIPVGCEYPPRLFARSAQRS